MNIASKLYWVLHNFKSFPIVREHICRDATYTATMFKKKRKRTNDS